MDAYENIIKKSFRLGRVKRSQKLRLLYNGQRLQGKPSEETRMGVVNASAPRGPSCRVEVYKFRRLPCLTSQSSEIEPLRQWLQSVSMDKALEGSFEDAFAACCEVMGRYRIIGNKRAYIGFPVTASNGTTGEDTLPGDSHEDGNEEVIPRQNGQSSIVGSEGDTNVNIDGDCENRTEGSSFQGDVNIVNNVQSEEMSTGPPGPSSATGNSDPLLYHMMYFLDLACNDYVFEMLSMMFDETRQKTFHFICGSLIEKFKRDRLIVAPLVMDVLLYSQAKVFGTKDAEELKERERSLRGMRDMFSVARETPFLKSYREMHWRFLK